MSNSSIKWKKHTCSFIILYYYDNLTVQLHLHQKYELLTAGYNLFITETIGDIQFVCVCWGGTLMVPFSSIDEHISHPISDFFYVWNHHMYVQGFRVKNGLSFDNCKVCRYTFGMYNVHVPVCQAATACFNGRNGQRGGILDSITIPRHDHCKFCTSQVQWSPLMSFCLRKVEASRWTNSPT